MTISTTSVKAVAQGNSATTVWPFTFLIPDTASLVVSLVDVATGNVTLLAAVNYSVSGLGIAAGGSVTYPLIGSPLTSATQLVIQRIVADTQPTTFANQSATYPADIEAALDRLTMITQQIVDTQNRSIVFSIADTAAPLLPSAAARASKFLGFDSLGNLLASTAVTGNAPVSAAMTPVIAAPTTLNAFLQLLPSNIADYVIPAGTILDYSLPSPAPAGWLFPFGQPCTSIYPVYRAALVAAGSPFGTNGTDPLMPDLRSAVSAGKSDMGGVSNGLLTGGTVLGALLGVQSRTLLTAHIPAYTPAGTNSASSVSGTIPGSTSLGALTNQFAFGAGSSGSLSYAGSAVAQVFTGTAMGGTSTSFSIVQPTLILNKIVKVH